MSPFVEESEHVSIRHLAQLCCSYEHHCRTNSKHLYACLELAPCALRRTSLWLDHIGVPHSSAAGCRTVISALCCAASRPARQPTVMSLGSLFDAFDFTQLLTSSIYADYLPAVRRRYALTPLLVRANAKALPSAHPRNLTDPRELGAYSSRARCGIRCDAGDNRQKRLEA